LLDGAVSCHLSAIRPHPLRAAVDFIQLAVAVGLIEALLVTRRD
jgi:hypothetical protein